MAFDFPTIIERVVAQFDVTDATATDWVNERQNRMIAEAQWRTAISSIGTTTAGVASYAISSLITDVTAIRIDGNGTTDVGLYNRVGIEELWKVDAGLEYLKGPGAGVFAEDPDTDGTYRIRIHPAPVTSGLPILALMSMTAFEGALRIPNDLGGFLLDGAFADGYIYEDERHDLAQFHEARFREGIELLRRRRNSRTGSGPHTMRVSRRP